MASSTEQTIDYLVGEVCKKTQSALHHQNGNIQHIAQISPEITDLVLRSQISALKITNDITHKTKSILISPTQTQELVNVTCDLLLNAKKCGIETLKMQFIISTLTKELDAEITKKVEYHGNMFSEQIDEIIKIIPYNDNTINKLYDDLFELLCLNEKYIEDIPFTDPEQEIDGIAEREINAALENVFPRISIKEYKSLSTKNKKIQIERLIEIIYGIRLYDRDIGKGGSSISDIPKLIEMDLSEIYTEINQQLESIQIEIENYTKIIELEYLKPGTITAPLLVLQSELRNRYQFVKYLSHYKDEIIQSTEILHTIIKKFNDELKSLHLLFKSQQNPLKTQVYPKFAQLSQFWKLFIAEKYCNESRKHILEIFKKFQVSFKSSLNEKDLELTILTQMKNNQNNQENFIPFHVIQALNSNIMQIDHNMFDPNGIKYNAFCLISLCNKNGLLFQGNKQTLIQLNEEKEDSENVKNQQQTGNKYCFYSQKELKEFASSPSKYFDALTETLIKYPELINILGLNIDFQQSPSILIEMQLNSMLPEPTTNIPRKISQGVETPTHFMEENIVPSYSWNEWDLRRRALQIVNMRLKQMKTHSCQTDLSHYKRDNATQYYLKQPLADGTMPGIDTQTGIERATNVPKQKKFITGLRGKPNDNVSVVTLTFDPPIKRLD